MILRQPVEFLLVEDVGAGSRAVPVRHLPTGPDPFELVEDDRAQRRHADAAADEDHLALALASAEIPKRSREIDDRAGPQAEEERRDDAGRGALASAWRRHG